MKLYLARHGATNYNELGLCDADPSVDVHLSKNGIRQAKKLAAKLKDAHFECIFISELRRTRQTADHINEYHHLPITIDPRLNDNRSGFEGRNLEEYYSALASAPNRWEAVFNDGESLSDVIARAQSFLDDLKRMQLSSVLVVTSMSIVHAIYSILNGLSNEEAWALEADNASCVELQLDSTQLQ